MGANEVTSVAAVSKSPSLRLDYLETSLLHFALLLHLYVRTPSIYVNTVLSIFIHTFTYPTLFHLPLRQIYLSYTSPLPLRLLPIHNALFL